MSTKLEAGTIIAGRYRLEHSLGEGGMGAVWAAKHTVTQRRHALKLLKPTAVVSPEMRRRFLREARAASAVDHPNVVTVSDVFETDDGTPIMVMDLLEGETLGSLLGRRRALSLEETADILTPVVSAVGTAHAAGVVHRDLKPDNIFLASGGDKPRVRVLDFGIAKWIAEDGRGEATGALTGTGTLLGTPCYMAPEQGFGEKDIDYRADLWALGVILYECLAGARPVEGANLGQVLKRLLDEGITPIQAIVQVPPDIADLVGRLLRRDRDDRPADLREVHEVLARYTTVETIPFATPLPRSSSDAPVRENGGRKTLGTGPTEALEQTAGPTSLSIGHFERRRLPYAVGGGLLLLALGAGVVLGRMGGDALEPTGEEPSPSASALAPAARGQREDEAALPPEPSSSRVPLAPSASTSVRRSPVASALHQSPPRERKADWSTSAEPEIPAMAPSASGAPVEHAPVPRPRGLVEKPPF